jgi:hypothetical protein
MNEERIPTILKMKVKKENMKQTKIMMELTG